MHHGIDYGGSFNVLAAQDGKVVHIGWSPRGGGVRTPTRTWGRTKDPEIYLTDENPDNRPDPDKENVVTKPSIGGPENFMHGRFGLKVDGRLGRRTWRAWQEILKEKYGYRGLVDGKPGKLTWTAVQKSGLDYGYKAKYVDGIPGPNTRKAVQRKLADLGEYTGRIDGIWGRGTISALQRALNKGKY